MGAGIYLLGGKDAGIVLNLKLLIFSFIIILFGYWKIFVSYAGSCHISRSYYFGGDSGKSAEWDSYGADFDCLCFFISSRRKKQKRFTSIPRLWCRK